MLGSCEKPLCGFARGLWGLRGGNENFQPGQKKGGYREMALDLSLDTKVRWLCRVSTWLGWTTFPRIPFSVCFPLGEACGDKVEMDHSVCSSHMVDYPLTHLIDEGQQLHLHLLHLFMNPPSACPTLKPRVYLTPRWSAPASPTGCPCHQGQRQWERTWVLAVLLDFSLSFPPATWH